MSGCKQTVWENGERLAVFGRAYDDWHLGSLAEKRAGGVAEIVGEFAVSSRDEAEAIADDWVDRGLIWA